MPKILVGQALPPFLQHAGIRYFGPETEVSSLAVRVTTGNSRNGRLYVLALTAGRAHAREGIVENLPAATAFLPDSILEWRARRCSIIHLPFLDFAWAGMQAGTRSESSYAP